MEKPEGIPTFEEFSKDKMIPCNHCMYQVAIGYENANKIATPLIDWLENRVSELESKNTLTFKEMEGNK